ncbi:MAG: DMT family transporter [Bacteroidales bacterium]|nr:DMT family transporter [Bacteroidales bacterium]
MQKSQTIGYLFAIGATVAGSSVYIFSKAAFAEVSLAQFGVYWFGMAIVWNTLFVLRKKTNRHIPDIGFSNFKKLLFIGLLEIIATSSLFLAIIKATDAAIPSFLRNMEYVFITIMGVILLRERFARTEFIGILLTFTGVFIISYDKNFSFIKYTTGPSGLMLLSSVSFAARTIIAKKNILNFSPSTLAINRSIYLSLASLIALLFLNQDFSIPETAFINIAVGSFLGPFVTSICQFSFLKYIEASRGAIIQSTTGLFVLTGAYLFLGSLPKSYQIVGGIITILGAVLLITGSRIKYRKLVQKDLKPAKKIE